MSSPLENLAGPGKPLVAEPHDEKTLGLGPEVWRVLAKAHDVRNLAEYEGDADVDERLVLDVIAACEAVASALGLDVP